MRLTKRYEHYDIIELTARTNTNCSVICHEMSDCESCPVNVALRKLADYEDAEEQGLLLRLPCPIGTKVYVLMDECEEMYEPDSWHTIISEESFDLYMVDCFGKEVFLTREEAEAALAEKGGAE